MWSKRFTTRVVLAILARQLSAWIRCSPDDAQMVTSLQYSYNNSRGCSQR